MIRTDLLIAGREREQVERSRARTHTTPLAASGVDQYTLLSAVQAHGQGAYQSPRVGQRREKTLKRIRTLTRRFCKDGLHIPAATESSWTSVASFLEAVKHMNSGHTMNAERQRRRYSENQKQKRHRKKIRPDDKRLQSGTIGYNVQH